jgi:hypothetical protein
MDFKKFGIVIAMLGLLIAGYGGVQLAINQPVQPKQSQGFLDRIVNDVHAASQNITREHRRGNATKVLIAGGIVIFLGFGMMASAKDGPGAARS